MSEREKEILIKIDEALPNMSEFDKGYFLGVAESNAKKKKREDPKEKSPQEKKFSNGTKAR